MKVMEWVTKSGDKLEVGRLLEKKAAAGIEGLKYHTEWQIRPVLLRERAYRSVFDYREGAKWYRMAECYIYQSKSDRK